MNVSSSWGTCSSEWLIALAPAGFPLIWTDWIFTGISAAATGCWYVERYSSAIPLGEDLCLDTELSNDRSFRTSYNLTFSQETFVGCDSPKFHDHIGNRALVFLQLPPAGTGLALVPLDFVLAGFEQADSAAKLSDSEIVLAGSDPLVKTDAEMETFDCNLLIETVVGRCYGRQNDGDIVHVTKSLEHV